MTEQTLYRVVLTAYLELGEFYYIYGPYNREQDAKAMITRRKRYHKNNTEFRIEKATVVWERVE